MTDPRDPDHVESPPVKTTTVRLDDATMQAVEAEAERLGMNQSQFIRQAVELRLTMLFTARTIQRGADPEHLVDADALATAFGEAEKLARRRQRRSQP
jgi:predicted transcriptional regulator